MKDTGEELEEALRSGKPGRVLSAGASVPEEPGYPTLLALDVFGTQKLSKSRPSEASSRWHDPFLASPSAPPHQRVGRRG